jgi:hypothetical protein
MRCTLLDGGAMSALNERIADTTVRRDSIGSVACTGTRAKATSVDRSARGFVSPAAVKNREIACGKANFYPPLRYLC